MYDSESNEKSLKNLAAPRFDGATDQGNRNGQCDDHTDGPQFGEAERRLASDKPPKLTDNKHSSQHQNPNVSSRSKREKSSHQKQEKLEKESQALRLAQRYWGDGTRTG